MRHVLVAAYGLSGILCVYIYIRIGTDGFDRGRNGFQHIYKYVVLGVEVRPKPETTSGISIVPLK